MRVQIIDNVLTSILVNFADRVLVKFNRAVLSVPVPWEKKYQYENNKKENYLIWSEYNWRSDIACPIKNTETQSKFTNKHNTTQQIFTLTFIDEINNHILPVRIDLNFQIRATVRIMVRIAWNENLYNFIIVKSRKSSTAIGWRRRIVEERCINFNNHVTSTWRNCKFNIIKQRGGLIVPSARNLQIWSHFGSFDREVKIRIWERSMKYNGQVWADSEAKMSILLENKRA